MPNLCKDCRWYLEGTSAGYDKCKCPYLSYNAVTLSLIRGDAFEPFTYCETARGMESECGAAGRFFEEKMEEEREVKTS